MKRLWLFIALLLIVATVGCQQINIDPNSSPAGFGVNPQLSEPLGQSFTAVAAHVKWIGMHFAACTAPTDFQLTLREGSGLSGTIVTTLTATVPSGFLDSFTSMSVRRLWWWGTNTQRTFRNSPHPMVRAV